MTKTPSSRLPKGEGLVMIVALMADLKTGLAGGLSSRMLYDRYSARLAGMSYRQFCRYVSRLREDAADPIIAALRPRAKSGHMRRGAMPQDSAPPAEKPKPSLLLSKEPLAQVETPTREITDGPRAAPRPRTFQRHKGPADDHKDEIW